MKRIFREKKHYYTSVKWIFCEKSAERCRVTQSGCYGPVGAQMYPCPSSSSFRFTPTHHSPDTRVASAEPCLLPFFRQSDMTLIQCFSPWPNAAGPPSCISCTPSWPSYIFHSSQIMPLRGSQCPAMVCGTRTRGEHGQGSFYLLAMDTSEVSNGSSYLPVSECFSSCSYDTRRHNSREDSIKY